MFRTDCLQQLQLQHVQQRKNWFLYARTLYIINARKSRKNRAKWKKM